MGDYYVQATVKLLADIASGDTADDTLLDALGDLANLHIDNILKINDEKIPYLTTAILDDVRMASNFYVTALYKSKREDFPAADHWMKEYDKVIAGIVGEREVDNTSYHVERHMGRRGRGGEIDHLLADWI